MKGANAIFWIIKTWRFLGIYGPGKTLFKVAGRLRPSFLRSRGRGAQDIGVIGCGQFAFSTIGYTLSRHHGNSFVACYDPHAERQATFARFYGIDAACSSADNVLNQPEVRTVYIASNHASHTPYAIQALEAGKAVYLEKPISVSRRQLKELILAKRRTEGKVFAGYNRPFSGAIRDLRPYCTGMQDSPMNLCCFVVGHLIGPDHWYRRPEEGTRVCGNLGHWLDLAVHMLCWNGLPDSWRISLVFSDREIRDDNMSVVLSSERGDLISILLSARSEPFEGINESIHLQCDDTIAKIDDFRQMTVWKGQKRRHQRYWPKDVGHSLALRQPFHNQDRDWHEIELSTLLMLFIKDMVIEERQEAVFSFSSEWSALMAMDA